MAHSLDFFWTEERAKRFLRGFAPAVKELGLSPEDLPDLLALHIDKTDLAQLVPSGPTCRRINKTGRPPRKPFMTGLLIGIGQTIRLRKNKAEAYTDFSELFDELSDEVDRLSNSDQIQTVNQSGRLEREPHFATFRQLISFLGLDLEIATDAVDSLFGIDDGDTVQFETYRFGTQPGTVVKEFVVFQRPTTSIPLVRFSNFRSYKGSTIQTNGFVVATRNKLSMIGFSEHGMGTNHTFLPFIGAPQNEYVGLVSTMTPDGQAIAAKMLFQRSEKMNYNEVETGQYSIKELENLNSNSLDKIRNRIPFNFEKKLFDSDGREIDQYGVISLVDNFLRNNNSVITDENGRFFNPASENNYTYNSALKLSE